MVSAPALIKEARQRAGLTQRALAGRAGVAQPVVSAYENGRRRPSLQVLERLVSAAGFALDIGLAAQKPLRRLLAERRADILEIARRRNIAAVKVFGSVARGDERPDSDIDLLVTPGPGMTLWELIGFEDDIQDLLHVAVDAVPESALKEAYRSQALAEAVEL
ncbi:MAG: helix-turn-helix domain-containing protein [Propionibacteriaceae bacterium]|jgi:predicted nucleotidyltransferase/DNA-binding XRE family transcriptional regulator|nr:helix-turn-helix domain-containing protein [Propionibacteriaceae bacterium]